MESGIPYGNAFIKNNYVGRTFIKPKQEQRESSVKVKLNVLKEAVAGKRVVMIDDSIVRGTTSARIVNLLKAAGAKEVHVRISSPAFLHPCYFGTDIPSEDQLIASGHSVDEICEIIGADSLGYLEVDKLSEMICGQTGYCDACYGNEHEIGQVFKDAFDEGVVERKDLFIMTKVWNDMHRRVEEACDKSIKDLQCDYVDMYFIHWPFPNYHAPGCDVDSRNPESKPFSVEEFMDTYRQCEALVEKGKIRYIGISNMTIPKLEAVLPLMKIKPATCELELHVCFQQQELYDYLVEHNIQPVGYMPIGSPRRPERDICPEDVADLEVPEMQAIAKAHGVHPALIALKWAHQRGEISIPFSVHNYASNLKCVTEDPLTEKEMATIATLEKGNRLVKGQVFLWHGARDWHDLWDEDGVIVK